MTILFTKVCTLELPVDFNGFQVKLNNHRTVGAKGESPQDKVLQITSFTSTFPCRLNTNVPKTGQR